MFRDSVEHLLRPWAQNQKKKAGRNAAGSSSVYEAQFQFTLLQKAPQNIDTMHSRVHFQGVTKV